ncbi:hypothetical protein L484_017074 [Morus notabilis]|uniref:Uncharacterized protein n=1 Tax=Morus notabilis TaxID=981085 RepID=W9S1I3_9ROSA|nr:hypothetical protein L484_017074 [Morus notabilis]
MRAARGTLSSQTQSRQQRYGLEIGGEFGLVHGGHPGCVVRGGEDIVSRKVGGGFSLNDEAANLGGGSGVGR